MSLSQRERTVVELVADGHTDVEIATLLDVTLSTVRTHLESARTKLDARNRAHCAVIAVRKGIIF